MAGLNGTSQIEAFDTRFDPGLNRPSVLRA